jgi:hypothetical protein
VASPSASRLVGQESGGSMIQVNGKSVNVQSAPDTPLLYVLRDELGLHGPRFGCGLGQCGHDAECHLYEPVRDARFDWPLLRRRGRPGR